MSCNCKQRVVLSKKGITVDNLRDFCIGHNYFTCGSPRQYEKFFELAFDPMGVKVSELSIILWVCSNGIVLSEIEKELTDFINTGIEFKD